MPFMEELPELLTTPDDLRTEADKESEFWDTDDSDFGSRAVFVGGIAVFAFALVKRSHAVRASHADCPTHRGAIQPSVRRALPVDREFLDPIVCELEALKSGELWPWCFASGHWHDARYKCARFISL